MVRLAILLTLLLAAPGFGQMVFIDAPQPVDDYVVLFDEIPAPVLTNPTSTVLYQQSGAIVSNPVAVQGCADGSCQVPMQQNVSMRVRTRVFNGWGNGPVRRLFFRKSAGACFGGGCR